MNLAGHRHEQRNCRLLETRRVSEGTPSRESLADAAGYQNSVGGAGRLGTYLRIEHRRRGFTLVELLVVIAVIGVLVGLFLPATRFSREAARRMSCSNNFKQVGLAMHNYHSANKHLPPAMGGTFANANRLSGLIALLPFMEQQALWQQISNPATIRGVDYPAMGPHPWVSAYDPWKTEVPTLRCPSDPGEANEYGLTNYAFSIGDMARNIHKPDCTRGAFLCGRATRFKEIMDGLSNTIAMGEIGTASDRNIIGQYATRISDPLLENPSLCGDVVDSERPRFYDADIRVGLTGRGSRWADGAAGYGLLNTILPPNSPSCALGKSGVSDGIFSAGSWHQGGTHVLMADGAVIFMTDSVEAGDSNAPTVTAVQVESGPTESPYGLWGALGTAAANEDVEEQLN